MKPNDYPGDVCINCPTWRWDEQPFGMYGVEWHAEEVWLHNDKHEWRGANIVPVDEDET